MPAALVPCSCSKCQGKLVPRSTKKSHEDTAKRLISQQAHGTSTSTSQPSLPTWRPSAAQLPHPGPSLSALRPSPTPAAASTEHPIGLDTLHLETPTSNPSYVDSMSTRTDLALSPLQEAVMPQVHVSILPTASCAAASNPRASPDPPAPTVSTSAPPPIILPARLAHMSAAAQVQELAAMAAAERRGQQAIRAARAAAAPLIPIADDDWEDLPDPEQEGNKTISIEFLPAPLLDFPLPVICTVTPQHIFFICWLFGYILLCISPFVGATSFFKWWGIFSKLRALLHFPTHSLLCRAVLTHMGAEPEFQALPVCPTCCEVFPASSPHSTVCLRCSIPVFQTAVPLSRSARTPTAPPRPLLQFPTKSIEEQLRDMLAVPGVEEEMDKWRSKKRTAGVYKDFFDRRIAKEIQGPDDLPFFRPGQSPQSGPDNELRIGLTLGVDWFSYLRSQIAPSHSSGPISFNIVNFRSFLRYRTTNLILRGIMPGPKEQDPDQVQRFMRVIVDELLRLWLQGFWVTTPNHPLGRLVRVILAGVICDKPAAHKMGGFGSHNHQFFCTRCWICQQDKTSEAAFQKNGFPERTDAEHRRRQQEYLKCTTAAAKKAFVTAYATRWCQLSRLPYFDLCRMIVIDPMHNLLLGLVKTHFYQIWVLHKVLRKTKEMRRFHALLAELRLPAFLGRLPALMGVPAGGSLTADQWLVAAIIVCPILIPQIWSEYMSADAEAVLSRRVAGIKTSVAAKKAAAAEARKKKAAAHAAQRAMDPPVDPRPQRIRRPTARAAAAQMEMDPDSDPEALPDAGTVLDKHDAEYEDPTTGSRKRARRSQDSDSDSDNEELEEREARSPPNLHPDDPPNFFKLATAVKLFLAHPITDAQIDEADRLLRSYGPELLRLYGDDVIKPNHHYATHTAENVRDYGPLQEFWTFLFERINKVLKSFNSSNHSGGELETSFFREFHRTVQTSRILAQAAQAPSDSPMYKSAEAMYKATSDDRGTIQALARQLDKAHEDGMYETSEGIQSA
ncbi:hypothetical protein MSAN_00839900 [Mycena sanguinolenta]|uniref:Uncharacterized protein n=1 Tax=Mycena sanguinolenta TaxID=230812 RepID=A0A8H6YZT1_9AGAR|nr:hypothetical protein MSAN_00839900 [Mycena sanguinolenta]